MTADYLLYGKIQIVCSSYQKVLEDLTLWKPLQTSSPNFLIAIYFQKAVLTPKEVFLRVFTSV